MIDSELLRQLSHSRPGFTMLGALPVAMPHWRLRLRVELLTRREISPLEEFVLRAAEEIDPQLGAIQTLLGLDDETFQDTIAALVSHEWARVDAQARLVLTEQGRLAASSARSERSEERPLTVEYDGLLRTPTLLDLPVAPAQRRSMGLAELPTYPAKPPDLLELSEKADALQSIIRTLGDGRDQEVDLLAVKGILRRDRVYREATLVIFRSENEGIQLAPVIDGVVSQEHESRLANPALLRQLRVASELRRGRRFDQILPRYLRDLYDANAQERAYAFQAETSTQEGQPSGAEQAAAALRALTVRTLAPYEHPPLLAAAIRTTAKRLLIVAPAITPAVFDRGLVSALRDRLKANTHVEIGYEHQDEIQLPSALTDLNRDHDNLKLFVLRKVPVASLVRDDNLAVRTLFPLLAYNGLERGFRDERGWLVTTPTLVKPLTDEIEAEIASGLHRGR